METFQIQRPDGGSATVEPIQLSGQLRPCCREPFMPIDCLVTFAPLIEQRFREPVGQRLTRKRLWNSGPGISLRWHREAELDQPPVAGRVANINTPPPLGPFHSIAYVISTQDPQSCSNAIPQWSIAEIETAFLRDLWEVQLGNAIGMDGRVGP